MKKQETKYIFNRESLILLGALFLLYNILAGYLYGYVEIGKISNKILIWSVVSITVLIHFIPLYVAAKVAKKLNRDYYSWSFLCFIFPFIGLVILSKLDYNFPDDYKNEANVEIKEFKIELKYLTADFQRRRINRKEYYTKKLISEKKFNKKLNLLLSDLDSNISKRLVENNKEEFIDISDNEMYTYCPACNCKLNDGDSECPDCGLNLR